jgi:hypothetical protein
MSTDWRAQLSGTEVLSIGSRRSSRDEINFSYYTEEYWPVKVRLRIVCTNNNVSKPQRTIEENYEMKSYDHRWQAKWTKGS